MVGWNGRSTAARDGVSTGQCGMGWSRGRGRGGDGQSTSLPTAVLTSTHPPPKLGQPFPAGLRPSHNRTPSGGRGGRARWFPTARAATSRHYAGGHLVRLSPSTPTVLHAPRSRPHPHPCALPHPPPPCSMLQAPILPWCGKRRRFRNRSAAAAAGAKGAVGRRGITNRVRGVCDCVVLAVGMFVVLIEWACRLRSFRQQPRHTALTT